MPANRSRAQRWREQLQGIMDRRGGIELGLRPPSNELAAATADLIWRVRLLEVGEHQLVVEMPAAAGSPVPLAAGHELVGAMVIGQNRWMFLTESLGAVERREGRDSIVALRLRSPETVERCPRRAFHRISTVSLTLPGVECWPLLDPLTVVAAEVANRAQAQSAARGEAVVEDGSVLVLPEVGPRFAASLANISGGGLGLVCKGSEGSAFDHHRLFWMRVDLRPRLAMPLGVTTRLAHAHRDSTGQIAAGLAFEFQFNPAHRAFVVEQICRYVEELRRERLRSRQAA